METTVLNQKTKKGTHGSQRVKDVKLSNEPSLKTGKEKFDNFFSKEGGLVIGSSCLLTGTSGAGKTTLMMNLMNWMPDVVISLYEREVDAKDVCQQTKNIRPKHNNAYISDRKTCPHFNDYMNEIKTLKPSVIIIDSIQTMALDFTPEMSEEAACNHISKELREYCSDNGAVLFMVGHNLKDGDFAGANTLKQLVDSHLVMEFDKVKNERSISFTKNRKGDVLKLYYAFESTGIEFYTEEEWKELSAEKNGNKLDFINSFAIFANGFISKISPKHENYDEIISEYNAGVKKLKKIEDGNMLSTKLLELVLELSNKYEL